MANVPHKISVVSEIIDMFDSHDGPLEVLLINPPYITLTSVKGVGHQVPLGLLMVGGALLDAGITVRLLDAECQHLTIDNILARVRELKPRIVMTGHAGSTPAHSICTQLLYAIKTDQPQITTVYGGVYPTYHAREILEQHPSIDIIVRGEGEATAVALCQAVRDEQPLNTIAGIAYRHDGCPHITHERPPLDMNRYHIGWSLIEDWDAYQCFGLGRAVIMQLSRGCPHHCTYCGQHGFWVNWRHRDPVAMVDEIEWLAREKKVRFVTLADENPTTDVRIWRRFLEELAERKLPVKFFATIRATDIVRDADIIHLYRDAGIAYILMGIETTDAATLAAIRKGSTTRVDLEACRLLTSHHIHAIIGHIVGFGDERWSDFFRAFRQLSHYDGDYLNAMYVMPHAWTLFAAENAHRLVIENDPRLWDYRHQILAQRHMRPAELFVAVKLLELFFHLRPRRLFRLLTRSRFSRQQFVHGLTHTGQVWLGEILNFWRQRQSRHASKTLRTWFGASGVGPQRHHERLMSLRILRSAAHTPAKTLKRGDTCKLPSPDSWPAACS